MLLLIIALLTLFWFYYINRISASQLLFAGIGLSFALVALLLPSSNSAKPFSIRLPVFLWIFPVALYIVAETELLHLRHTGLGYVIALAFTLLITALAEEKPAKKVAVATAIVGISLIPLYTLYAPPPLATTHGGTLCGPRRRYRGATSRRPQSGNQHIPSRWFRWSMP